MNVALHEDDLLLFPQSPSSARPWILYTWDLSDDWYWLVPVMPMKERMWPISDLFLTREELLLRLMDGRCSRMSSAFSLYVHA